MLLSLSKNHTPYEQLPPPLQVEQDSCNKIWHRKPSYLCPKLWNLFPNEHKTIKSLAYVKAEIKTRLPENYPRRLCETYTHQVGFI